MDGTLYTCHYNPELNIYVFSNGREEITKTESELDNYIAFKEFARKAKKAVVEGRAVGGVSVWVA